MLRWFRSTVLSLVIVVVMLVVGFGVTFLLALKYSPSVREWVYGPPTATWSSSTDEPTPQEPTLVVMATEPAPPSATTRIPEPSATWTSRPTWTSTASPWPSPSTMDTATIAPSPTPTSTPTPTPTPSPAPTQTRAPTPRPPRPTSTPASLPAPVLRYPREGMQFVAGDVVKLQWKPVGDLPAGAYYVPTVTFFHSGEVWTDDTPWLQDCTWTISEHDYLPSLSDHGVFRWSVRVMRQTGVDPKTGKPVGVPLSPRSEQWTFLWTE